MFRLHNNSNSLIGGLENELNLRESKEEEEEEVRLNHLKT